MFNTFLFLYKCASLGFQMQATDKGGRVGPDSYSETNQVSSSCVGASYEHARACSTHSPNRILPLSYFILQPERGYSSLRIGTKETHDILHGFRLYWNSTVKEKKYRSWALKFVYTIGINSTKISNMLFN